MLDRIQNLTPKNRSETPLLWRLRLLLPVAVVAAGISLALPGESQAALMSCTGSFTTDGTAKVNNAAGTLTAADACEYLEGSDPSNVASLANINSAAFFGFSDWVDNGQTQIEFDPALLSGDWSIDGVNFAMYDYAIFFKDGADTNLIGFLFNELFSLGTWLTPLGNPPFDVNADREVSHLSIVKRLADDPDIRIPEPATLLLFGIGLLGLGAVARRRRKLAA